MKAIRRFTVRTVLPEALAPLDELSTNLRWSWHEPTRQLFREIDPSLWEATGHDPIALLGAVEPARLSELAADATFVATARQLVDDLHAYLTEPRWYQTLTDAPASIGYFSPEFGIAAALPQYSGGLGILAGDHLKSAGFTVKELPVNSIGGEAERLDQTTQGLLEVNLADLARAAQLNKLTFGFSMPYLFESLAHLGAADDPTAAWRAYAAAGGKLGLM